LNQIVSPVSTTQQSTKEGVGLQRSGERFQNIIITIIITRLQRYDDCEHFHHHRQEGV